MALETGSTGKQTEESNISYSAILVSTDQYLLAQPRAGSIF